MSRLTIRSLDAQVKEGLRVRAARNGRSMEAEVSSILAETLALPSRAEPDLAEAIRRRFASVGSVELEPPPPGPDRRAASLRAMIVLDTNVLSELMRPQPHAGVVAWVAAQPRATLYTTSITRAEILYEIAAMPDGRWRDGLGALVAAMFDEDFASRILPFTAEAAPHYARIVAARRRAGAPIEGFDALIAATALAAGGSLAIRDAGGFAGCGLTIIDPRV